MRVTHLVPALLIAAVAWGTPPAPAAAEEDTSRTTWAVEPANADGPDSRVSVRTELVPGATVVEHVAVTNYSAQETTFDVYASDGVVTADGQFDLLPAGTPPEDAGAWMSVGDAGPGETVQVVVGPEATVTVPVGITVPEDATPGDHPAGVVASVSRDPGEESVTFDARVGVRMHLRVSGDLEPTLALTDVETTYSPSWLPWRPGTLTIDYAVENTGNVRLGAETTASASGPFGWASREETGPSAREVLPGQAAGGSVTVDAWPLVRTGGSVSVVPVVVGDDLVEVALTDASATWTVWTVPWLHLGLLLVAAGTLVALVQARRRREARTERRIAEAVAAARPAATA
ncbi:hypothetical protein [Sanguibacter suaedae]|uniref:DUF916 domain-containing protein n=1 Tax=Sanguibacter suaedae TaxID=2795737 RepID=A0A934M9T7_9MICO|nr:hypothetical protein [Sanguibacter suaedae]MBI9113516.1 hypothetical protein [Sanguibacter suaedae]